MTLLIILLVGVFSSYGQTNYTDEQLYGKCYAMFTDSPLDPTDVNLLKVKNGELNPIDGCMKLLSDSDFKKEGTNLVLKNNTATSRSVMRKFHQFHLSWFSRSIPIGSVDAGLFGILDHTEPALYLTESVFGDRSYDSVLTRSDSIRGTRSEGLDPRGPRINNYQHQSQPLIFAPLVRFNRNSADFAAHDNWNIIPTSLRVQSGQLIGIEKAPVVNVKININDGRATLAKTSYANLVVPGLTSMNVVQNYGGGIVGSTAYLLMNRLAQERNDGGINVHRRYANNFFKDVLCLNLPTLTAADVQSEYDKYNKGSEKSSLSFRNESSCLQCHTTMDNFSSVARNLITGVSGSNVQSVRVLNASLPGPTYRNATYVRQQKAELSENEKIPSGSSPDICRKTIDSDQCYQRRKPVSRLVYRNYRGELVDTTVEGPQQMGEALAKQDDMYMCAAQRYYSFLTGVTIPMQYSANSNDPFIKKHYDIIEKMGLDLKKHKSMKQLIRDIISGEAYKAVNPLSTGGQGE